MSEKKIKIGFSIDDSAFARVESKIARLTNQLKGLNAQLNAAQKGGSGSVLSSMGGDKTSNTTQSMRGGSDNKQLDRLTAGYLKQADALKKLAEAGKSASDSMAKSLDMSINKQLKSIEKLSKAMGASGLMGEGGAAVAGRAAKASGSAGVAGRVGASLMGRAQTAVSAINSMTTGGGITMSGLSSLARAAGPYAAVAGAVGLGANEWYQSPYRYQRREVEDFGRADAFARRAESMDISDLASRQDAMRNAGKSADLREIAGRTTTAGFRNAGKAIMSMDLRALLTSFSDAEQNRTIKRDMEDYLERNKGGEMARDTERSQGLINDAMSTVRARRILGYSGSDGNGGYRSDVVRLKGRLARQGFELGDATSAIGQMAGMGSASFARNNYGGAMSAQAGLMNSAGMMSATMSKFGQGNQFLDLMRGVGAGKTGQMDVTVANTLGEAVASAISNQMLRGSTGQGLAQFLGAGVGQGSEGRLTLEQNMRGMQSLENISSGNIDSYQQARNLQVAMASGAKNIYAQDYLAKMSTSRMAEIVYGNADLSKSEKGMGLTKDMVKSVFSGKQSSISERAINDPGLAGTSMGATLSGVREFGGDFGAYVKANKGNKGFDVEQAIADYGAFMSGSGAATDLAAGEGAARMMALGSKKLKRGSGRVAGGVSGEVERAALDAQGKLADFTAEENERVAGNATDLAKGLEMQARMTDAAAKSAMTFNGTIEILGETMRLQAEALSKVTSGQMNAKQAMNWLNDQKQALAAPYIKKAQAVEKKRTTESTVGNKF